MNFGQNPQSYTVRAKANMQGTTLLQAENINDDHIQKEVTFNFKKTKKTNF